MERDEAESSTPHSLMVSSVVVVDKKKKVGGPGETSKARNLERVKDLHHEYLACRQELGEVLRLETLSHEDLSNHYCVDWLKAHEAHVSRDKTLETADLTGIPKRSIMGPVNYRPLKERNFLGRRVGASRYYLHRSVAGRRPKVREISWDLTAGQRFGSLGSLRSWSSESNHRGGISL